MLSILNTRSSVDDLNDGLDDDLDDLNHNLDDKLDDLGDGNDSRSSISSSDNDSRSYQPIVDTVQDSIMKLKIEVLKSVKQNQKYSLNDAVLRTEIDRLRSLLVQHSLTRPSSRGDSLFSCFSGN